MVYEMKKVAFVCVCSSCRSQIAEALGRRFAGDAFESHSAGTETESRIDRDAVRLMREICISAISRESGSISVSADMDTGGMAESVSYMGAAFSRAH